MNRQDAKKAKKTMLCPLPPVGKEEWKQKVNECGTTLASIYLVVVQLYINPVCLCLCSKIGIKKKFVDYLIN